MRLSPLYAPDGMTGSSRSMERFDDGLVHNHHWAVTSGEAYPFAIRAQASDFAYAGRESVRHQTYKQAPQAHDRHDDGLVHNHDWAVTGK